MSQLKIPDLFEKKYEKELKRMEIYDNVLVKCHKRIKYYSQYERTYCFFQIPEFIFGVPLYNINDMKKYIINSLKSNGFQIMYIDPNWLFINWGNQEGIKKLASQNLKKEIKKKEDNKKFKSVDNYKPSGSIYDESALLGLSGKLN
jgi:hypothetical protein